MHSVLSFFDDDILSKAESLGFFVQSNAPKIGTSIHDLQDVEVDRAVTILQNTMAMAPIGDDGPLGLFTPLL